MRPVTLIISFFQMRKLRPRQNGFGGECAEGKASLVLLGKNC